MKAHCAIALHVKEHTFTLILSYCSLVKRASVTSRGETISVCELFVLSAGISMLFFYLSLSLIHNTKKISA